MKQKRLTQAILIIALTFMCVYLHGQVTIGSGTPPNKGALLDLTEGVTTNKGLGLPKVKLTSLTTSGSDLKVTVDGATGAAWDKDEHIGLLVYNTNQIETATNRICPGIHIWEGNVWKSLKPYPQVTEIITKTIAFRGLTHLDPNNASDPMWATLGKNPANYSIGYIGTFTDNRPNDTPQSYHYTRFYVGYTSTDTTYTTTRDYSCAQDDSKIITTTETKKEMKFEDGVWMAQNLRAIKMPDGTAIANNAILTTVPNYHYPNLSPANRASMGVLYNWFAAVNGEYNNSRGGLAEGPPIQGVCPDGWHLPSDRELTDLENGILKNTSIFSSLADIGGPLIGYNEGGVAARDNLGKAMKSTLSINGFASGGLSKAASAGGFDLQLVGTANYYAYWYGEEARIWSRDLNPYNNPYTLYFHWHWTSSSRVVIGGQDMNCVRCIKN